MSLKLPFEILHLIFTYASDTMDGVCRCPVPVPHCGGGGRSARDGEDSDGRQRSLTFLGAGRPTSPFEDGVGSAGGSDDSGHNFVTIVKSMCLSGWRKQGETTKRMGCGLAACAILGILPAVAAQHTLHEAITHGAVGISMGASILVSPLRKRDDIDQPTYLVPVVYGVWGIAFVTLLGCQLLRRPTTLQRRLLAGTLFFSTLCLLGVWFQGALSTLEGLMSWGPVALTAALCVIPAVLDLALSATMMFCCLFGRKQNNMVVCHYLRHDFKVDIIFLRNGTEPQLPVVALLDTQCQKGNWISGSLLETLGMSDQVMADIEAVELCDANGKPVKARGAVDLLWRTFPYGTRNHYCRFYVLPQSSDHLDVILGAEFIHAKGLLVLNLPVLLPLVEHKKITDEEQRAIDEAQRQRVQEMAELEAHRNIPFQEVIEAGIREVQTSHETEQALH
ncbi:hypothetical protein V8F06_009598 [Rhypophila decipiens]